jgi:lipooligosaccharide transport system ATP-binding protein
MIAAEATPAEPTPSGTPAELIQARGLTKRFGDFTAVDGIDVDGAAGESFGFLGPNGAGKSSTMRMMAAVSPGDLRGPCGSSVDPATHGPASARAWAMSPPAGPPRRGL